MENREMEMMGSQLRRRRRRLGLTLDELAGRTGISKPYLSLIETGRVPNPPSDQKLRRLEQALGFGAGELVSQAHWHRTPRDVREMLRRMMAERPEGAVARHEVTEARRHEGGEEAAGASGKRGCDDSKKNGIGGIDLDDAYLSGVLAELVEQRRGNVEAIGAGGGSGGAIPVINKVSAGYPKDFTDMSYPRGVADEYVASPDVRDVEAFAARVHGDSMMPKYREGDIVIFSPAAATRSGDDCFVRFADGHTTFKRVFFEKGEQGEEVLRLQPRNERYRPQVVGREEVTGVWRAVWRYQRIDEE